MKFDISPHISGDTWKGINSITILSLGIPLNLTDCTVRMQLRPAANLASPIYLEFSTDDETILIVSEQNGIINIPSRIIDIPVGKYNFDLQIEFPTGIVRTYLTGIWEITNNITR